MTPYLLIILINMQALSLEFPDAYSCIQAKEEISKQMVDMKDAGAACFKKLGSHQKQS